MKKEILYTRIVILSYFRVFLKDLECRPIEAMLFGTRVITTRCASIPEVTQGKAVYVDDPYDVDEWIDKVINGVMQGTLDFSAYEPENVSRKYLQFLKEPVWEKTDIMPDDHHKKR